MAKLHIVQCLCPKRHAIIGMLYPGEEMTPEKAEQGLKQMVDAAILTKLINPWCGICRSRDFHYEASVTKYDTLDEAAPELRGLVEANAIASKILGEAGQAKNN